MALPHLHQMIVNGDKTAFAQAMTAGADVNQLDPVMGNSPLHIAAQQSDIAFAKALIESRAFINLQTPKHGVTPLMVAVWHRKPAMVEFLLQQVNTNIEIVSTFGLKAEQLIDFGAVDDDAFANEQGQLMHQLFDQYKQGLAERQAKLAAYNLMLDTELADEEKITQVRQLASLAEINTTSPVTSSGNDEHTAVMVAARDGLTQSLRQLMALGGDQTIPDHYMKAIPLHKAAYNGHADVITVLADYPGFQETLNAQGPNNGYTPLHDAIWHGHTEAAAVLLNAGARIDLKGYDGKTPLELAHEFYYQDIIDLFEDKA
ncbi:ankyrin repeat domain-containing protein [Photobacterium sanctipauli]|uniref:Ankyrin repeat domain-containing protein n=1 Tax=Photobacterium sanctipauli TaxID=1342794 RepID=A0A2T3P0F5_9GAMM|nr:ankyrin repeat domain-containing protein [Photobacterium sanctipauli]PSW21962.1 ankyrin repeat domain-containing protein [Photobacterium sanctipauli]